MLWNRWKSAIVVPLFLNALGWGQINVLTANYGVERTNANLQETKLTPTTVSPYTFGKIGSFSIDGQVYAQPLYVSALSFPDKSVHNVLFVATMHNSVYAFDADAVSAPAPLWQVNLGPSVPANLYNVTDINPEIGILSTGAIDLTGGVLYVVSEELEDGLPVFRLHALDLATGQEKLNGPAAITASLPGDSPDAADGMISFDSTLHLQRPSLLLANGSVYAAFGSHGDQGNYHGWLMRYNASDLSQPPNAFLTTSSGIGGAIWQSGRGLAADDAGNVYAVTGNGPYDGDLDFSESFLKFSANALNLVDSFTPANWQILSDNDWDIAAGPALLPGTHTLIGGDKSGTLYLVQGDSMGGLASPTAQTLQQAVLFGGIFNFALWNRTDAVYVYVQEQGGNLKCYRIVNGMFEAVPVSVSTIAADIPYDGIAISANGGQGGILWETVGDHSNPAVPGTLHAFDASDLGTELWNSDMNPSQDSLGAFAKFANPTVANGKVYVPTFSNAIAVYGIFPEGGGGSGSAAPAIASVVNSGSYSQSAVSPGEVISIFGSNLGPASPTGLQLDIAGRVAKELAGTQVLFDGRPGPMLYASPTQINAIVPFVLTPNSLVVRVVSQGQTSSEFQVTVAPATPAIFAADSSGSGQGMIFNQDGSPNSPDNPAMPDSVISLYATGLGQTSPSGQDGVIASDNTQQPVLPVTAAIAGEPADVLSASSAAGLIEGIIQVNIHVPVGLTGGPVLPIVLQAGGISSQPEITIAVQTSDVSPAQAAPKPR